MFARRWVGIAGLTPNRAGWIQQANRHKVPLKYLLGEWLRRLARLSDLLGTRVTQVDLFSQPNEGIGDDGIFAGVAAGMYGFAQETREVFSKLDGLHRATPRGRSSTEVAMRLSGQTSSPDDSESLRNV